MKDVLKVSFIGKDKQTQQLHVYIFSIGLTASAGADVFRQCNYHTAGFFYVVRTRALTSGYHDLASQRTHTMR